jgi:hypothetical protein
LGCAPGESTDANRSRISIAPGTSKSAEIQAALDAGFIVDLEKGDYELETPIMLRSGTRLFGAGSGLTRLLPTWTPDASLADTPNNGVLVAQLEAANGPTTVITTRTPKDSRYVAVADASVLSPGWVRLRGNSEHGNEYEMSDGLGVILTEYVEAVSIDGGGIVLSEPTWQFHGPMVEVRNVDALEDVEISGFDIVADGGAIATGILLDGVIGVRLSDIAGAGFARAFVELGPGTRRIALSGLWSRGENNSLLLAESVMDLVLESFGSSPSGLRSHSLGIPRALLTFSRRCTAVSIRDGSLANGCVGIRLWGGHHVHISSVTIRDMQNDAVIARDPLISNNRTGCGIDSGAGPLHIAEFAYDVTFEDVHLENCRQPTIQAGASWHLHDIMGLTISNCSISNKGESPWTAGRYMVGMLASDVMGSMESLTVRGVAYAFHTINTMAFLRVNHLDIFGSPGDGMVGGVGVMLEHGAGAGPTIERLAAENLFTLFATGPEFIPDWNFTIADFRSEGFEASDLVLARSQAPQPLMSGDVVEFLPSSGSERLVTDSTGPTTRNAIIATGRPGSDGTGLLLVCAAPVARCHVRCTSDAVQIGDILVASSTPRRAEVNNAPANALTVLGKALTAKAAGAEGLVLVGPA